MVVVRIMPQTIPAELIVAFATNHMVSSIELDNTNSTVGSRLSLQNFLKVIDSIRIIRETVLNLQNKPFTKWIQSRI